MTEQEAACPIIALSGIEVSPLRLHDSADQDYGVFLFFKYATTEQTDILLEFFNGEAKSDGVIVKHSYPEQTWRTHFEGVTFETKTIKPVYGAKEQAFDPPPANVIMYLQRINSEQLEYMLSQDNIIGFKAQKQCLSMAIKGALNQAGVWILVKYACAQRLKLFPEDAGVYSYMWSMAKQYSLNTDDMPKTITTDVLFTKIKERDRISDDMVSTLGSGFVSKAQTNILFYVNWARLYVIERLEIGGKESVTQCKTVAEIASLLIKNNAKKPQSEEQAHIIKSELALIKILPNLEWVNDIEHNITDVCKPDDNTLHIESQLDAVNEKISTHEAIQSICNIYGITLTRVFFCKHLQFLLINACYQREQPLLKREYYQSLNKIISLLSGIICRKTYQNIILRELGEITKFRKQYMVSPRSKFLMRGIETDYNGLGIKIEQIEKRLGGHDLKWWWEGHSFSRNNTSNKWEACDRVGQIESATSFDLLNLQREYSARQSRLSALKTSHNHIVHTYNTSGNPIMLSSLLYESLRIGQEAMVSNTHHYLSTVEYPRLLGEVKNLEKFTDAIKSHFENIECIHIYHLMALNVSWSRNATGLYVGNNDYDARHVQPGNALYHWSEFMYYHLAVINASKLNDFMDTLCYTNEKLAPPIDEEDELFDQLTHFTNEINELYGDHVIERIENAIENPNKENHAQLMEYAYFLKESGASQTLITFMRRAITMAYQYGCYRKETEVGAVKRLIRISHAKLFSFIFVQFINDVAILNGRNLDGITPPTKSGDCPFGEIYMSDERKWFVYSKLIVMLKAINASNETFNQKPI